jgi:hypothetical protein
MTPMSPIATRISTAIAKAFSLQRIHEETSEAVGHIPRR